MDELKPCPFCGKEPIQDYKSVYCRYCFMMDEPDVRIDTWNMRPLEDALTAKLEKAKEAMIRAIYESNDLYADPKIMASILEDALAELEAKNG